MELAHRGSGFTAPNPMVGAILVHDGRVIGEGWHHHYGADHAEVNCLRSVQEENRNLIQDSAMYVNLEPCAHYGITPPCSARLVQEHIKKVVIANCDPYEKVSGKGIEILRQENIQVETGLLKEAGVWLNRRFFCFHQRQRPYIILKWAKTKEGYIAPLDRKRFRITGEPANILSHKWRTEESAIMVGTTTALHDNPQLTARKWPGKQPLRIVIDRTLKLPEDRYLFDERAATWIVNEKLDGLKGNVHFVQMEFDNNFLPALLKRMVDARLVSVIVEGGANLLNQFLNQNLWDEARVFTGAVSLPEGVVAPLLKNAGLAFSTELDEDRFDLYLHNQNAFNYPVTYFPGL